MAVGVERDDVAGAVLAGELVADPQRDAVAAVALEARDVHARARAPRRAVPSRLPSSTTSVSTPSPHAAARACAARTRRCGGVVESGDDDDHRREARRA